MLSELSDVIFYPIKLPHSRYSSGDALHTFDINILVVDKIQIKYFSSSEISIVSLPGVSAAFLAIFRVSHVTTESQQARLRWRGGANFTPTGH